MGPNINYTRRSTHPNHGVAKSKLEERRERQLLAQNRMQEAVNRAVRSTAGGKPISAYIQSHSTAVNGKKWAFSHARREGDRRMGPAAPTHRSALPKSGRLSPYLTRELKPISDNICLAYAMIPPEKTEKKKLRLLATEDWASLSRSNSPASKSSSATLVQDPTKNESSKVKGEQQHLQRYHHLDAVCKAKLDRVPEVKIEVKKEKVLPHYDTSSVDMNMPSSPPQPDTTLSSSIQSNFSSSFSGVPSNGPICKTEEEDIKPSSDLLSALLSTQDSVATQASITGTLVKEERSDHLPDLLSARQHADSHPLIESQVFGSLVHNIKNLEDFIVRPIPCPFLLPCMLEDAGSPFIYDGVPRSVDYLGMAFAALKWERWEEA